MMKITGLSHLFKWENLHNWWLTKYFFAPLYKKSNSLSLDYLNNKSTTTAAFCTAICHINIKAIEFTNRPLTNAYKNHYYPIT